MDQDPELSPQPDDNYVLPIEQPEKKLPKFAQRTLEFGPYAGRRLGNVNVSHLIDVLHMSSDSVPFDLRFDVKRTLRYKIRGAA
jgi:hypothetical protein